MRAQLTLLAKDGHEKGKEYVAMLRAADTNCDGKVDDAEVTSKDETGSPLYPYISVSLDKRASLSDQKSYAGQ